jgi:hypothetical protein
MPGQRLGDLGMHASSGEVADVLVPKRMKIEDAIGIVAER